MVEIKEVAEMISKLTRFDKAGEYDGKT